METNNQNQKTPKTEPSAEDKALAELVRTKVLDFVHDMSKLCKDNGLSFYISGWTEDPVDRGETPNKTLTFRCGNGNVSPMVVHKIIDISVILQDCIGNGLSNEVPSLCKMTENLIGYTCKKVMSNLNKKMNTDNKSKTKEN